MEELKATRTVAVTNHAGFHLRAATLFVTVARRFESRIEVIKDGQRADGKSTPLQLTALGALEGDQVVLEAIGTDADDAVGALAELFAANFDEDESEDQAEIGSKARWQGASGDDISPA